MRLLPLIVLSFMIAAGPALGATTKDTSALPSIAKQVAGSKRMDGFFDLYWDGNQGRLYLQIDNLLNDKSIINPDKFDKIHD